MEFDTRQWLTGRDRKAPGLPVERALTLLPAAGCERALDREAPSKPVVRISQDDIANDRRNVQMYALFIGSFGLSPTDQAAFLMNKWIEVFKRDDRFYPKLVAAALKAHALGVAHATQVIHKLILVAPPSSVDAELKTLLSTPSSAPCLQATRAFATVAGRFGLAQDQAQVRTMLKAEVSLGHQPAIDLHLLIYEQAKSEYERLKAGMGAKESDALFGACARAASNSMSGRNSLEGYLLPTCICFIKGRSGRPARPASLRASMFANAPESGDCLLWSGADTVLPTEPTHIATMTHKLNTLLCALVTSLACALPAHATQQASQVEVSYLYPNLSTLYAGPVSTSLPDNLSSFAGILNIALTTSSFTLTLSTNAGVNNVAFDGVRFVDLQQTLNFGQFALDTAATNYAGFNASRVTFSGPDTLYVNLQGLPGLTGQQIVLNAAPVPEPAAWALMACGLVGLLGAARRRA